MHRERKIPPDNTQTRAVILLEFTNYLSRGGAGWTLEVAEFLQRNRRAGLAANMQRLTPNFAGRWSRYAATCDSALFRAIEHRTGADRQRRHRGDDDKRKRALHGKITVGLIGGNCLQVFLSNPRTHRKQSVRVKRDATRLGGHSRLASWLSRLASWLSRLATTNFLEMWTSLRQPTLFRKGQSTKVRCGADAATST